MNTAVRTNPDGDDLATRPGSCHERGLARGQSVLDVVGSDAAVDHDDGSGRPR